MSTIVDHERLSRELTWAKLQQEINKTIGAKNQKRLVGMFSPQFGDDFVVYLGVAECVGRALDNHYLEYLVVRCWSEWHISTCDVDALCLLYELVEVQLTNLEVI